ncbi:MAG: 4-(cytidine 5'-diphospho)-2-C-methyl-D-erythritol kinase [Eubacteriales bacterium]
MNDSQTVFCPAKINLFLEVLDRRADGYHNIDTVMQSVNLCDTVRIRLTDGTGRIGLECTEPTLPTDRRNIAYLAGERYLAAAGRQDLDLHIAIEKKIPLAAGLAGGSADAAGVLIGLDRILHAVSPDELGVLAKSIGADVPFCMRCGCARAGGIGEILTPVTPLSPEYTIVVAKGGEGVSTKEAYEALDADCGRLSAAPMADALNREDVGEVCDRLYNAFEKVVPKVRPMVGFAKNAMLHGGAMGALMSGSGPSVFGIFYDLDRAEAVCEYLKSQGYAAFVCAPVR